MHYYLGLEIGGTKLQIGIGTGEDNSLFHLWRETVDVSAGGAGIRKRIASAVPELLKQAKLSTEQIAGVGIGFGGPVDDDTGNVLTSHQISGWDDFPLVDWVRETLGLQAVMGNDADVAGLAEALIGAGRGLSPVVYVNVGSGIGGAFIVDGSIYRGVGLGAVEVGHLRIRNEDEVSILEHVASGWALGRRARLALQERPREGRVLLDLANGNVESVTAPVVAKAAMENDPIATEVIESAWTALAEGLCHVVALLCPKRIVIGGGVSLLGDQLFVPLRELIAERAFRPFAECFDVVPAALGEEVVVQGAIILARQRCNQ